MDESVYIKPKDTAQIFYSEQFYRPEEPDINSAVNDIVKELDDTTHTFAGNIVYPNVIKKLLNTEITLSNYEEVFCLKNCQPIELPPASDHRNIRYKDKDGTTLAIVQIYLHKNKIKLQTFGHIFPKQEYTTPQNVLHRIMVKAEDADWSTEDGGINQFDGNIETRYKDKKGNVMAAVITKKDGITVDTIVEYQYSSGKKSTMLHTNQYGQSMTIYNEINNTVQMCIDIDTDGCIYSIVKNFNVI